MTSGRLGPLAALPAVGCRRFLERCASRHLGQAVRHARLDEENDLALRTPEQLSDRFWLDVRQARNQDRLGYEVLPALCRGYSSRCASQSRLLLGPPQPPQKFLVTLERESSPQDGVLGRLARVTCDRTTLTCSIDADLEVDLFKWPAHEARP